tara:strand:- start:148 stop:381 length:234 start_codon:yes stop_codon:yes gene_type:complete
MKKLTKNQMLIGGGVIALIYVLYRNKKAQKGSNMVKNALKGDPEPEPREVGLQRELRELKEVSQSEGNKNSRIMYER